MSNLGDLVYNLIGNATSFVSANDKARASNDVLSGSVNSIIGQLNRQIKAYETSGRTTLEWINADKKASDEVKEHTRALLDHANTLKAADAAKRAFHAGAVTPTQMMANADSGRRAGQQAMYDDLFGAPHQQMLADRRVKLAAATEQRIADEQERIQTAALTRQERRLADSQHRQIEQTLSRRAATNALDDRMWFAPGRSARHAADDALVQQQLTDQGYFAPGGKGHKKTNQTGRDNRQWAGVEGFRAIEDFAQGSAYGGLRGGLLAASNNIGQMGAAFGAAGAMAGSLVSTAVILGSTLYESWRKSATGGDEALASITEYDRMVSSVLQHTRQMQDLRIETRGIRNEATFGGALNTEQSLKDDITRRQTEITSRQAARVDQMAGMGAAGLNAADLDKEAIRREETIYGLRRNAASAQAANLSDEALTIENRNRVREQERQDLRDNEQLVEKRRHLAIAERIVMERGQHDADVADDRRRAHERGGRGPVTEWEQMDIERGHRNEQNRKEMEKFGRGQSWMQSRSEDLLLSGMRDPKDQAAYRAEKEHQESLRRSAEAEKLGLMTPNERSRIDKASMEKRDRDMREAKYGNLQADGASGFQSADIKSTQGFNAVIKAMRYSEQEKTIAELKRNGDITAELLASSQRLEEIAKMAPVQVVDF